MFTRFQTHRILTSNILRSKFKPSSLAAYSSKSPDFGICIDIDGVLARGHVPVPRAKEALERLHGNVPLAFVTNQLSRDAYKAYQLGVWFGIKVQSDQMVQAQGPLAMYPQFHNKRCLLVGQGPLAGIAGDIGFTSTQWMDDVALAYPMLNVMDHQKRYEVSSGDILEFNMSRIEAVILLGEPKHWEMCLQLIMDLLLTEGHPVQTAHRHNHQTLPVIVCNTDLQFMHRSAFPRFGHGAFVLCLEALFKKVTGKDLEYTAVLGKPSEITFRYAEHCLALEAQRMGIDKPLRTMYMIGDNMDVDIIGANLYQEYLNNKNNTDNNPDDNTTTAVLPPGRTPPADTTDILPSSVEVVRSVLVRTGVSVKEAEGGEDSGVNHIHREFMTTEAKLRNPTAEVDDIMQAVDYIAIEEGVDM